MLAPTRSTDKEKMLKKFNLFLYFIKGVKERYKGEEKLGRYHVLKLLFIASLKPGKLRDEGVFTNYLAMKNGPIEVDCWNFIKIIEEKTGKSFEKWLHGDTINV